VEDIFALESIPKQSKVNTSDWPFAFSLFNNFHVAMD